MSRPLRMTLAAVCGIALMAGGVAYAAPKLDSGVRLPAVLPHTSAPGVTVQTQFVPITPCRIVDTRLSSAGILKAKVVRKFVVAGTAGFTGQGGKATGCGIPNGTSAIAASITATGITGTGIIHAWPNGASEPNATVLNYNKVAGSITSGVTLAVNSSSTSGLAVKAMGANTQFVVDVTGYYREPIAVEVKSDGSLGSHSSQVVSAGRNPGNGTGVYAVQFDHSITGCVLNATAVTTSTVLTTAFLSTDARAVIVVRAPTDGSFVNSTVDLTVTC